MVNVTTILSIALSPSIVPLIPLTSFHSFCARINVNVHNRKGTFPITKQCIKNLLIINTDMPTCLRKTCYKESRILALNLKQKVYSPFSLPVTCTAHSRV